MIKYTLKQQFAAMTILRKIGQLLPQSCSLIGSVFLLDRGDCIEENLLSLKRFSSNIEKLEPV